MRRVVWHVLRFIHDSLNSFTLLTATECLHNSVIVLVVVFALNWR